MKDFLIESLGMILLSFAGLSIILYTVFSIVFFMEVMMDRDEVCSKKLVYVFPMTFIACYAGEKR